jgi:cytochrome c553
MLRNACPLAECSIAKEGWTMKHTFLTVGMALLLGIVGAAHAAGDAKAGKAKAGDCAGCHGANGEGVAPNPPLAGKKDQQLLQAMNDYRTGKRANALMKSIASQLNDQQMADLAAYYSSLKGK